jgi:hypothetical protein
MPLTNSIDKPLAAEHTVGPIAVFSNSYARLPEHFFARLSPTPVAKPRLIKFNESLASELGVDTRGLEPDELAAVFAGNVIPPGAEPIAMAYAGHQFGNFVPQLGGRSAVLPMIIRLRLLAGLAVVMKNPLEHLSRLRQSRAFGPQLIGCWRKIRSWCPNRCGRSI